MNESSSHSSRGRYERYREIVLSNPAARFHYDLAALVLMREREIDCRDPERAISWVHSALQADYPLVTREEVARIMEDFD